MKAALAALAVATFGWSAWAKSASADADGVVKLDFSDQMNMGLEDDTAGDGKGGWNDDGENNGKLFPLGRPTYCGIPFRTVDPEANDGKALLVLENHRLVDGPREASADVIPAAPARFVYVMHAAAWSAHGTPPYVGSIVLTGEGGRTHEIPVEIDTVARAWWDWQPVDRGNAWRAAVIPAAQGNGSMWVSEWPVPPELGRISKVAFRSPGRKKAAGYWMILAATLTNDETSRRVHEKEVPPVEIRAGAKWKAMPFPEKWGPAADSILDLTPPETIPVGRYGRLVAGPGGRLIYEKRPDLEFRSAMTWPSGWGFDAFSRVAEQIARDVKAGKKCFTDFACTPYTNDLKLAHLAFAKALKAQGYRILRVCGLPGMTYMGLDFDDAQLDNFFWMLKCFRDEGIYVHLDSPASFTWYKDAWMWNDNYLGRARYAATRVYWREDVRRNWKEGMTRYFNIVNPYTGLALKDDPVIAFIEFANEANMRSRRFDEPEAHAEFAKFLARRHGDLAGVRKAWGNDFEEGWTSLETIPVDVLWMEGRGRKGERHRDMQEFYVERMTWLLDWHVKVMREIGYKGMMTEYNMVQTTGASRARRPSGYIAHNAYFNHPFGKSVSPISPISTKNSFIRGFVSCQYDDLPMVLTEADICYPSPKRYEQPFVLDAYAAMNGIDVVNGFCLTFPCRNETGSYAAAANRSLPGAFFGWFDPVKLASEFLAGHFLTRGKVRESDVTCRVVLDVDEILGAEDMTAGLGTLQTQLALVTRFAIGWKDRPVTAAPGAKVLDLPRAGATEVRREVKFSNMVDSAAGAEFDADKTVAELKRRGWISASNRTDVKKGVFESSTGELFLDVARKYGTVDAPAAQGLFAEKGATARLLDLEVVSKDIDGMLCAVSKGDEPLRKSRRIAVVFCGNALGSGMKFRDGAFAETVDAGKPPVLLETGRATFRLKSEFADVLRCFAVDLNGTRTEEIPVEAENGVATVTLDTAALKKGPAIFFELFADENVRLRRLAAEDYARPVRPIGVDGQEAWNVNASRFTYPPTFAFTNFPGAAKYRFSLIDDLHGKWGFEASAPNASLAPVWARLPEGFVTVRCEALDAKGAVAGFAGERTFWKKAGFEPGAYPATDGDYEGAARRIYGYIFVQPYMKSLLRTGKPDMSYALNGYPSKMLSAQIHAMVAYAKLSPKDAPMALKAARLAADSLIARAQKPGAPLEHFPPTYDGGGQWDVSTRYAGMQMLVYPAQAGDAYLALAKATGEAKYRDEAKLIGETYLRLQGEDGTWFLKLRESDGKPVNPNRLTPSYVILFLENLAKETGDARFASAADRAFGYIERGPLVTWNWEGQFEDVEPTEKFVNLTKHDACFAAKRLLERHPGDAKALAQARELLRFAEDQFVEWTRPYDHNRAPGRASWGPTIANWQVPAALEQYHCYVPIDASTARLVRTYLALYRAEGSPLDLAKAKALGDTMLRVIRPDGRLRTFWDNDWGASSDWTNCQVASALALEDLAAAVRAQPSGTCAPEGGLL